MKVIYRMCGIPSTNPSPILQEDKFKLNKLCLRSFERAFIDVCPDTHFLLDHCDDRYEEMIDKEIGWGYSIERTELGINGTMLRAYELASTYDDFVLFQECDYLYHTLSGVLMLSAMNELGIVSPYDHLNFYQDKSIHSPTCDIALVNNYHYRSVERNTMTWGCHSDIIKNNLDIFMKYGYLDDEVWKELLYAGHKLWVPVPSLATHMVKDYLAPGIDWEAVWQKYL